MDRQKEMPKARTGVPGLDDILLGGLAAGRVFLLEGSPGTGKTTMAMRFLVEGAQKGERGLYVTLSETEQELHSAALSHGWELGDNIDIFEVVPPESLLDADQQVYEAYDPYLFVRDAYLQNQRYRLYDGNVPEDDSYLDDLDESKETDEE